MTTTGTDSRPRGEIGPARGAAGASFTGRAVILALVAVGLLLALAVPVRSWFAQRAEIAALRADVAAAQQRVGDLQIQQQRWSDPSFIAAEARRRLHFVLPGEVGYVTLGSGAAAAETGTPAADRGPWYSELWGALQQADDHAPSSG